MLGQRVWIGFGVARVPGSARLLRRSPVAGRSA
jgi:hypothetical protein